MTQMSQQPIQSPQFLMVPVREGNGLGVAGFFIALIGLVIPTGIVALLGLLVSLVALGKAPRGFAGMGVVVGLIGTVVWVVLTGAAVLAAVAVGVIALVFGAGAFILTQPEIVEVTSDMVNMSLSLVEYQKEEGELPQDLAVLGLGITTITDPWGNAYRYELIEEEPGFDVISNGGDGTPGTTDDLALSRIDRVWEEAFENFGEKMEDLGQRLERLEGTSVHFDHRTYSASARHGRHKDDRASQYERAAIAAAVNEAMESIKANELALAVALEKADAAAAAAEVDDSDGSEHAEAPEADEDVADPNG